MTTPHIEQPGSAAVPARGDTRTRRAAAVWWHPALAAAAASVAAALYAVFVVAPDEKTMGAVQRIFYFHVGSAVACYVGFGVVLVASLWHLGFGGAARDSEGGLVPGVDVPDVVNEAAAEVGFLFCSITLASGMIWGKSAWNTWFRWEPRLVTFLLLWMVFLVFHMVRKFGDPSRTAGASAVLGVVGASVVPLVWMSVKLFPSADQLHPQVVERGGLTDPGYGQALLVTVLATNALALLLFLARSRIGFAERQCSALAAAGRRVRSPGGGRV